MGQICNCITRSLLVVWLHRKETVCGHECDPFGSHSLVYSMMFRLRNMVQFISHMENESGNALSRVYLVIDQLLLYDHVVWFLSENPLPLVVSGLRKREKNKMMNEKIIELKQELINQWEVSKWLHPKQ